MSRYGRILEPLLEIVDLKTGIVRALVETVRYNDEPKFFQYTALLCNTLKFSDAQSMGAEVTGSTSPDRERGMLIALGEAAERYCASIYNNKDFLRSSYRKIRERALDPNKVSGFSKKQKHQFEAEMGAKFEFDEHTIFRWVRGQKLDSNESIYIPAQLVYPNYQYLPDEPIIRFPMSTGLGASESLDGAICRGICEVIERDAYMITWLNHLPQKRIEIVRCQNEEIRRVFQTFKKYKLEILLFDITIDIPIPTVLCVILDRTHRGPAVSTGTATNLDIEIAVLRSIEEAFQKRIGNKMQLLEGLDMRKWDKTTAPWYSANFNRCYLWSKVDSIRYLDFLHTDVMKNIDCYYKSYKKEDSLEIIIEILRDKNVEAYYVDLTTPEINDLGFKVIRAIIPELQPLHTYEEFMYLGGKRLYSIPQHLGYKQQNTTVKSLNEVPYP